MLSDKEKELATCEKARENLMEKVCVDFTLMMTGKVLGLVLSITL